MSDATSATPADTDELLEKDEVEAEELGASFTAKDLLQRARQMFTGGSGSVAESDESPCDVEVTVELLQLASEAVQTLFEQERAEVQRSCTMLDREEALGYLLADVRGQQLLPEEARAIGKRASKHVKAAKEAAAKAAKAVASKRCKARAASASPLLR